MEWVEFLDRLARRQGLRANLTKTLKARLDERNDGQRNIKIAADLHLSEADIKKQLGEIYEIFAPNCPDLANSQSRGKLEALRACLWQQYERHQSQPDPPKIVGTPSNLPFSGVVKFVGREEALTQVHEKLQATERVAISSVSGMGGVGKTELALQYAYRQREQQTYPGGICWVNARAQDVGTEILMFARVQLGLPEPPEALKTVPEQVQWVCRRWQGEPILLVLDDLVEYGAVEPYVQALDSRFRVLITTRLKLGTATQRLELEVLTEAAALELLRALVDDPARIDSQLADAQALCDWLGYLPLALELVGRYLAKKRDLNVAELLLRLQDSKLEARALVQRTEGMTAPLGVAAAFELSWAELPSTARHLCGLLGIFALAAIPWELVQQCLPDWEPEDLEDCRDDELVGRSLLERVGQGRYQLHQLIREFFAVKLVLATDGGTEVADGLRRRVAGVLTAVAQTIPYPVTLDVIARVADALPHLAVVATGLTEWLEGVDKLWASTGLARVAEAQSRWQEAEQWLHRAREIAEQQLGADHLDTAGSLNNLAELYRSMGHYGDAEPLYLRSLEIREQQLGADHPTTATGLNNLALLYYAMGHYGDAEPLYLRSLAISEQQLGADHPTTAGSLNNLAALYQAMGRYEKVEPLYLRSLEIVEKHLGADHPTTATSLNNLAESYRATGRYGEAEPLHRRSLAIREQQLGAFHPTTASSLNNLALLSLFCYFKENKLS